MKSGEVERRAMNLQFILMRGMYLIGPLVMAIACIIFIARTREISGVVALAGTLGQIAAGVLSLSISWLQMSGHVRGQQTGEIFMMISLVNVVASLMFAGAFVFMVLRIAKDRSGEPARYAN